MVKIRTIQIRLTRNQYDQIKNDCLVKGFGSLSSYLRFLALNRDESIANKVTEMHQAITERAGKTKRIDNTKW